jgi:hypothetical protein
MKFKTLLLVGSITGSILISIGCNNKSKTGAPPPVSCPSGQVASPAGCVFPGNMVPPVGYIPPYGNNGLTQYFASKTDFITQRDTLFLNDNYKTFLKEALGVCDRCYSTSGSGMGEALECGSWMKGFNMLMLSFSNYSASNQISFYSTPTVSQTYYNFAWQFPKIEDFFLTLFTGIPAPSCNQGQFSPYWAAESNFEKTGDQKGFSLFVNQGPFYSSWNRAKLLLEVPVGQIGDPSFNFRLIYIDKNNNRGELATGTLTRCASANCGLFY